MKARIGFCTWRPLVGAAVVSALAIAVSVQGSPRVGGERDKGSGKSEASRVVTGPSAHINSAIAQAGTTTISLVPVLKPASVVLPGGYTNYSAGNITGAKVTLNAVPARVWLEIKITGFAALSPPLATWQATIDSSGYAGANAVCGPGSGGADLFSPDAAIACTTTADCNAAVSGASALCAGNPVAGCQSAAALDPHPGFCFTGYQDQCRADWINVGAIPGVATSTPNYAYGSTPLGAGPTDFGPSYGGTLVLDAPAGTKGLYTIGFDPAIGNTFLLDNQSPQVNIDIAALNPAQIEVPCGKCCFGVGTAGDGCADSKTKGECDLMAAIPIFTAGDVCDAPPTSAGCCACLSNADCDQGDQCMVYTCNSCVCSVTPKASWDQANECCNAADGSEDPIVSPNQCTAAACTLAGNRGDLLLTPRTGLSCDDANPCTYADTCSDGVSCAGLDANLVPCASPADCQAATGVAYNCVSNFCECKLEPDVTAIVDVGGKGNPGGEECYTDQEKITGSVFMGASSSPISGAQIAMTYDPTCLEYVGIAGSAIFPDAVYGPVVDETAGTIFFAVGIGFGGVPTSGNVDIANFSFLKIGTCNTCEICFTDVNPQHTYLSDADGQKVKVVTHCSTPIKANNTLVLTVPGSRQVNADCSVPSAIETWDAPSVTDSCGTSQVICRGEFEDGTPLARATAEGGGELPIGASSFCCYAVSDYCGKIVGCPPDTNCANDPATGKAAGCWTVNVNDETSLDITVGLERGTQSVPGDTLTRCIKFTLYSNCWDQPLVFTDDVTFGGLYEFVGKSTGKIKIPGVGNWTCITAQDQLHTLRSCYTFAAGDCAGGQLNASFKGDPQLGGNWLIAGNLDGWKKELPDHGAGASLDVIDILDYGTFVSQYGINYGGKDTPCPFGTSPNADLNGDGVVGADDYAYLSMNFLVSSKQCCCGPQVAGVNPVTEISVAQLRALGMGDLAVADLNGDGLLNLADMAAFDQGVRPTKTTPTKGGTRSSGSR